MLVMYVSPQNITYTQVLGNAIELKVLDTRILPTHYKQILD